MSATAHNQCENEKKETKNKIRKIGNDLANSHPDDLCIQLYIKKIIFEPDELRIKNIGSYRSVSST